MPTDHDKIFTAITSEGRTLHFNYGAALLGHRFTSVTYTRPPVNNTEQAWWDGTLRLALSIGVEPQQIGSQP